MAGRPGNRDWNRVGLKKKQGKKKPGGLTWQDPVKNLVATR
jgi:hypothetical protein